MELNIKDLKLFKVTKIKPWAIYFTYDNERYLLHGRSCDYEYDVTLYKRIYEKGKFRLKHLKSEISDTDQIMYNFLPHDRRKNIIYKHIDNKKFIKKLSYKGFCRSVFDDEIEEDKKYIEECKKRIKFFEKEIRKIRSDMNNII